RNRDDRQGHRHLQRVLHPVPLSALGRFGLDHIVQLQEHHQHPVGGHLGRHAVGDHSLPDRLLAVAEVDLPRTHDGGGQVITTDLHTGWRLSAATDTAPERLRSALAESIPAQVPGCVHTDLLAAGLIDDPYLDDNEAAQRWIGLTHWTHRTTLVRPAGGHARHDLVFDGLDTVATVRVNGGMVHESANQHRSYRIEVTDVLTGGEDELEVAFASPVRYANAQSLVYGAGSRPYPLPYEAIRKSACSFGWDWGIHTATSGIWRPVRLESWSGVRLGELRLVAEPDGGGGRVRAEVQLAWAGRSGAAEITLEVAGARSQVVVPPNTNPAVLDLTLQEVQRWWPVGYGDQVLYDAQVSVSTDGRTRDVARRRVGFRTVRW